MGMLEPNKTKPNKHLCNNNLITGQSFRICLLPKVNLNNNSTILF